MGYDATDYEGHPAAEVVADLALGSVEPRAIDIEQATGFVVPRGAALQVIRPSEFDALRLRPRRVTGTIKPATIDGLVSYVSRHKDDDALSVWVHPTGGQVVAILDDHEYAQAGWGEHRVITALQRTPEWDRWTSADGKWLSQESFAELIEDGLGEIAVPEGAELLEIAQTMSGSTEVTWRAAQRLANGSVKFGWDEEVTAAAGTNGELEVPTEFVLVVAPFVGHDAVQINARLRYRVAKGELKLSFRLDNPHRVVLEVIGRIHEQLNAAFPERVYLGEPRS